ncbi:MAG: BNR-4 repeat-containing protein [Akkermansiaceae bacterium]|jgi:hypothetical protein|nr:BNR-4 repeat-containing protein [Akkermansiaceae bacterium]
MPTLRHFLATSLLPLGILKADLTYLDATTGTSGNTTLANGSTFTPPGNGTTGADNNWELRTGFANSSSILEASGETSENAPEIRTRITGLTPGASYIIHALFWDGSGASPDWNLRAGFTSNPGANTLYANPADAADLAATAAIDANTLTFAGTAPLFTEDDRTLFAAPLGSRVADGTGTIWVYLDDLPSTIGVNNRTWYDGLAYELDTSAPPPGPGITYRDANLTNTARWDGQTFAPAAQGNTIIDNNWETRTLGNSANVFESNADGAEDAPLLVTTLTGLQASTDYILYAYFWHDGRNWRMKASGKLADIDDNGTPGNTTDDFLPTHPSVNFASAGNADGTATVAPAAVAADFVTAPMITEGNRTLRQAVLGKFTSNASGVLQIYIDDLANSGEATRTWFDGVGFKPASSLSPEGDEDGDGLTNAQEEEAGTNLFVSDTDFDGFSDSAEVASGSDPLDPDSTPPLPGNALAIAPDGAWTWFNDERAIFHQGSLFSGYVLGDGRYGITRYDPATNTTYPMIISTAASREQDDHNNPSITVLPDGKLLILYTKHITEPRFYQRTSLVPLPSTESDWGPEIARTVPANNTYNNTYLLSGESNRIYNFHRCINFNPTITVSNDLGATWQPSIQFISVGSGGVRPYPRYCSNGTNRIDLIYTDGHPRDVNNSIYHMYYQSGAFRKTDGTLVKNYANLPINHEGGERGSVVYQYSSAAWGPGDGPDQWIPNGRGWTWDVHYGQDGHPVCVFQVQVDNVTGSGWNNDRIYYYYARWTGTDWQRRFIAQGGRPLYAAEDDYGGGMCIDPENPNVIYISSNAANPFALGSLTNVPLRPSERYEIWRGVTADGGLTFTWEALTQNSAADNLRPIVPQDHGYDRTLLWFNGTYSTYTSFDTQVLALLENEPEVKSFSVNSGSATLSWVSSPGRRYRIVASTDLDGFPYPADGPIESQGSTTTATFPIPQELEGLPKGFFRVEEMP